MKLEASYLGLEIYEAAWTCALFGLQGLEESSRDDVARVHVLYQLSDIGTGTSLN
jgi:hypothetical protein